MIDVITRTFTPEILAYLLDGALLMLELSVVIVVCSVVFGLVLALLRNYEKFVLGRLAGIYIEIFRNTPNLMWVLICYVYAPLPNVFLRCTFAFVLFTSAAMAEIIRGGLMSLDAGQAEAGRSLGLNYLDTMRYIVVPQAFKNILPALGNEFIVLLKDTSLIQTIGGKELLYAAQGIATRTYSQMFPLIGTACIYLVLVMIFSWLQGKLERRLRQSDRR